ncbi:MAG: acetate--CoA ligase family protein [Methanolinea sp.]|nr:acetate--CoA ligase family protein [Methanolinea sp.]
MNTIHGGQDSQRLLTEKEGLDLLARAGVPVPEHGVAKSAEEAGQIAQSLGFPVVMKVISPQVVHKSDAGGVTTGIRNAEEAREAFLHISRSVREKVPGAVLEGMMVEREYPPGLELLVGGKTDPAFGKVITFGMGGTLVELLRDVAIRVLPVDITMVKEMIREIRGYPLVRGYRNSLPLDEEALADAILRVADRFLHDPEWDEFDINPLILYQHGCVAVDARVYITPGRKPGEIALHDPADPALFYPRSVAVIGASSDPHKIGYVVLRNLLQFPGSLYPVNPRHPEILGKHAYPSVGDIPGDIDAAVIAIPARAVPGVLKECADKGVKLAIILSSGFRESGDEGKALEEEILEIGKAGGIRIVGPNCLGIIVPHESLNTTFDPVSPREGPIGFISQSGAVITTIVDWSIPEHIGFSMILSVGNQVDLGFVDFLRVVAADPHTHAIILYIEEIRRGREFLAAVKDITGKKPVIALKSGSSGIGQKAAASHTGSLAGNYQVYQAAFLQAGVIPVYTIQEAFDVAELLASEGYPRGNRALVVTTAGGFAVMASDYAEWYGITLPPLPARIIEALDAFLPSMWSRENPLDIIGDGGAERYARVFDVLTRFQDDWDIAVVIAVPSAILDPTHLGQEIARFSKNTHKMVIGCLLGGDSMRSGERVLRERHIPNYREIDGAFRAVGRALSARLHKDD